MGVRSRGKHLEKIIFKSETNLLLFVNAFCVFWIGNLWDLLIVDWLIGVTFTPKFVILPGTEGAAGYKDYAFHFRGFLIGTVISVVVGLVVAGVVSFL